MSLLIVRTASVCLVLFHCAAIGYSGVPVSYVTGQGIQLGTGVAVTEWQGNAYLLAYTDSPYIDIAGLPTTSCNRSTDIVLVSFNAGTKTPRWARCFGGSLDDRASAIAVGGDGSIYIAGSTNSPDLPGAGRVSRSTGGMDGFIMKLTADGATLLWTALIGGTSDDRINALFVSGSGDVYAGGETESADLPVVNPLQATLRGPRDGFISRLNGPSGSVIFSTYIGGTGTERVLAVSGDLAGNVYAAGMTDSTDFPVVSPFIAVKPGAKCGFVSKIRPDGTAALYSTYLCGSEGVTEGSEQVNAIAVSSGGTAYVGGVTSSTDFPLRNPWQSVFRGWNTDGFVAALAQDGRTVLFSTLLGGGQSDAIAALNLDEAGGIINAAGYTMSLDFPDAAGASGPFVVQFSTGGQYRKSTVLLYADLVPAAMAVSRGQFLIAGTRRASAGVTPSAFVAFIGRLPSQLIWTNDSTRQSTLWQIEGARTQLQVGWWWISAAGAPGWKVVAMGDFDRDGTTDLVWQNDATRQATVWYQTGSGSSTNKGWNWMSSGQSPGWSIITTADFNGDGTPDLVWQNDTTRQVTVWYMTGAQGNVNGGWNWLSIAGSPGWSVVAAADINRDGVPDLIWQNDATRQATVWFMGGVQGKDFTGWSWLTANAVPGWRIVAVSDIDGDGVSDLIWQNEATRQATVWYMGGVQGNVNVGWEFITSSSVPGWSITASR